MIKKIYSGYDEINEQGLYINYYIQICTFCPDTKKMFYDYKLYENKKLRDRTLEGFNENTL